MKPWRHPSYEVWEQFPPPCEEDNCPSLFLYRWYFNTFFFANWDRPSQQSFLLPSWLFLLFPALMPLSMLFIYDRISRKLTAGKVGSKFWVAFFFFFLLNRLSWGKYKCQWKRKIYLFTGVTVSGWLQNAFPEVSLGICPRNPCRLGRRIIWDLSFRKWCDIRAILILKSSFFALLLVLISDSFSVSQNFHANMKATGFLLLLLLLLLLKFMRDKLIMMLFQNK